MELKNRADRNRTVTITAQDITKYKKQLLHIDRPSTTAQILNKTICQDIYSVLPLLPASFVDLLFIDPPYNLNKNFNSKQFKKCSTDDYAGWIDSWLSKLMKVLRPTASVYICSDWRSSPAVYSIAGKYLKIRNRITWEREKGRGALRNWKNASEDIWFCTVSDKYTFNLDKVKLKRKVIAPYTLENGQPYDTEVWVKMNEDW